MHTAQQYRAFQRFKHPKFPLRTDAAAPAVPHWESHSVEQAAVFFAITASLGPESRVADAAGCRCLGSRSSLRESKAPLSGARSRSATSRGCPAHTARAHPALSLQQHGHHTPPQLCLEIFKKEFSQNGFYLFTTISPIFLVSVPFILSFP